MFGINEKWGGGEIIKLLNISVRIKSYQTNVALIKGVIGNTLRFNETAYSI